MKLDTLKDDKFGDLDGKGSWATGGTIAPGATYDCAFTDGSRGERRLGCTSTR